MARYYRNKYPLPEELVMVKIERVEDMGAYVRLLEYGGVEGLIPISELAKGRVRSIGKLVRPGQKQVVLVTHVDEERDYVDLSKKRVHSDDIGPFRERFQQAKRVTEYAEHVAIKAQVSAVIVQESLIWPLADDFGGNAYRGIGKCVTDPSLLVRYDMVESVRETVRETLHSHFASKPTNIRMTLSVTCYGPEGIDAIKAALNAAKDVLSRDASLRLRASPLYDIEQKTLAPEETLEEFRRAAERAMKVIGKYEGGNIEVVNQINSTE